MKTTICSLFAGVLAVGLGLFTMSFVIPTPKTTTFLLVKHAETADGSCKSALNEIGNQRALMLPDLLKTTSVDAAYHCGNQASSGTLSPLTASKGLKAKSFESEDLKKSLHKMYADNLGKTVIISADDAVLAQLLDLLTGEKGVVDVKAEQRGMIYQVKSDFLGKGRLTKVPYATHLN